VAEYLLYPSLRGTTLNLQTGISVTVIAFSTWAYSHYKESAPAGKIDRVEEEAKMEEVDISSEDDLIEAGEIETEYFGLSFQRCDVTSYLRRLVG